MYILVFGRLSTPFFSGLRPCSDEFNFASCHIMT